MKVVIRVFLVTLIFSVAGCSASKPGFLQHRDNDYLSAKTEKPLVIPPGMSSSAIHSEYPVSEHAYEGQSKKVSILPPGISS